MSERIRNLIVPLLASVCSGLAVALAFPDFDVWPLAWVAYVPLLMVIEGASAKRTFLLSWLAGTTANFVGFFWMSNMLHDFGHLPFFVSVLLTLVGAAWQGLSNALSFWLALFLGGRLGRRPWLLLPLAYTFFEFLHPILFPWFLGNCQYHLVPLIQVCDLFGVSFLTFLLVLANAVVYEVIRSARSGQPQPQTRLPSVLAPGCLECAAGRASSKPQTRLRSVLAPLSVLVAVLAASLVYGFVRVGQVERQEAQAATLKLGIIEPEIPIFEEQLRSFPKGESPLWVLKWNTLNLHAASARLVAEEHPDLVVWPESTYFPALSVYARRAAVDHVTLSGSVATLHRPDGGAPIRLDAGVPLRALVSRGDGRTLVAGTGGAMFSVSPQGLEREKTAGNEDVNVLWYGCQGTAAYLDTPEDQCLPMAAGANGTLLARSGEGWVKLKTDASEELLALTGFAPGSYVAAGKGVILVGNVKEGVTARRSTPDDTWVAAVAAGQSALVLSADGVMAKVTPDGTITLSEKKLELPGHVRAMDLLPDGSVLVATSSGLCKVGQKPEAVVVHPGPMSSVSCDQDGRCLALEESGKVMEIGPEGGEAGGSVDGEEGPERSGGGNGKDAEEKTGDRDGTGGEKNAVTEIGRGNGKDGRIAVWPYARYYWWLPEDAAQIYRARLAVPAQPEYPASVIEDLGQPERTPNAIQRGFEAPILFGATSGRLNEIEDPNSLKNARYNSAFLADSEGMVLGRYDKQYLLAFGEYIPFGDWFPILYEWSPESGRFLPGPAREPLEFRGHRLGVLICYEDIIPGHTNSVAAAGAQALVNLTNDAWFGKTKEARQHFVLAAFRAVEQRLPLVRATTTGISGFVSATGEIRHMTDPEGAETFTVDLPLLEGSWTVYRAGGRHFPWVAGLVLLSVLAVALRRGRGAATANGPEVSDSRSGRRRSASAAPSPRSRS
jgi:apolipoprotein N-acyltransferase